MQIDFSFKYIYIQLDQTVCTYIQSFSQGPNPYYTVQYSIANKTVTETEGGAKTPLSHNLAGSEPRIEAHRLDRQNWSLPRCS